MWWTCVGHYNLQRHIVILCIQMVISLWSSPFTLYVNHLVQDTFSRFVFDLDFTCAAIIQYHSLNNFSYHCILSLCLVLIQYPPQAGLCYFPPKIHPKQTLTCYQEEFTSRPSHPPDVWELTSLSFILSYGILWESVLSNKQPCLGLMSIMQALYADDSVPISSFARNRASAPHT